MMIEPSLASKLEAPCLLSVVVPVFNEEAVLPAFHQRLGAVLGDLGDDCEVREGEKYLGGGARKIEI
ncbi:hypothetical protein Y89_5487 [Pseudomonas aeruginosa]|nr:hypothetical protein Y89_5487 [Pseudomonas aeruginosa]AXO31503.1 hypothetical protein Ysp71_5591 [Pseudomonas aeruginosa]